MNIYTGSLPKGFCYVPQDNYLLYKPKTANLDYLYADSATSCIIIIVVGKDKDDNVMVGISHLSCEVRFNAFFEIIEKNFKGGISVYAAGANPPKAVPKGSSYSYECVKNAKIFMKWAADKIWCPRESETSPNFYIKQCTAALGSGIPNNGFGAYGIGVNPQKPDYLEVSNKYFHLPDEIRDPENGANILFCKLGLLTKMPSLVLRDMTVPLSDEEKTALVHEAKKQNWESVLNMSEAEILDKYSTTPDYEPAWFARNIVRAAEFVESYV